LTTDRLRWRKDPLEIPFETTADLTDIPFSFGQPRAEGALSLGLRMHNAGHIFVCGPPGTARRDLIRASLAERSEPHTPLCDFLGACLLSPPPRCYLIPRPAGTGRALQADVDRCIEACREAVRALPYLPALQPGSESDADVMERSLRQTEARVEEILRTLAEHREDASTTRYLEDLKRSIRRTIRRFLETATLHGSHSSDQPDPAFRIQALESLSSRGLRLIREGGNGPPPLIVEAHPSLPNLFGYFIHGDDSPERAPGGAHFFQPGSLLEAQGGFLAFDFEEAVREPGVWNHLKRCLRDKRIVIPREEPACTGNASFLPPDPVPLETRLVVWGDENIYQEFYEKDPDFSILFKLRADLVNTLDRNSENQDRYLAFLKKCGEEESLPPFHRTGAAAFLEAGAELAGKQNKLSAHWEELSDILRESGYRATLENSPIVRDRHLEGALENRRFRRNLPEEQTQEMFQDGSLLIQTEGTAVGQVNGIALCETEDYAFGKPFRITAQTGVGRSGIINIEREASLSGKIHDKGMLILCGYLRERYARDRPMNLSASLCIEQLYSHIDGDSASLGEICTLLSRLGDVPLSQGLAVTGSISQRGEVQPVGYVNEKILGFFQVCLNRGLTGEQGVIIPQAKKAPSAAFGSSLVVATYCRTPHSSGSRLPCIPAISAKLLQAGHTAERLRNRVSFLALFEQPGGALLAAAARPGVSGKYDDPVFRRRALPAG
jgi:predicted ATP-dependent protease